MPIWLQHMLVLVLVAFCLWVVGRDTLRALGRRASRMAGCGSCKGCDTDTAAPPATPAGKPQQRMVFLPADALTTRVASRYKH